MALYQDLKNINSSSKYSGYFLPAVVILGIAASLVLFFLGENKSEFPEFITDAFTFTAWVNQGEDFLKANIKEYTRAISGYVKTGYFMLEDFLLESSWVFIAALLVIPSLAFGELDLLYLFCLGQCTGEW